MQSILSPVNLESAPVYAIRIFVIHAALTLIAAIAFAGTMIPVTIVLARAAVAAAEILHLTGTKQREKLSSPA
jgi:hypothetical protein